MNSRGLGLPSRPSADSEASSSHRSSLAGGAGDCPKESSGTGRTGRKSALWQRFHRRLKAEVTRPVWGNSWGKPRIWLPQEARLGASPIAGRAG
jgi:hypothetical protein